MTISSPESEPHVEHAITANGIRQGHTGGLVLRQLHIGLAVGFALVACLTAFGGGVIVGMWYKASEQSAPRSAAVTSPTAEQLAQSQETASQPPEPQAPVTFYNTLTNSNVAYAPLTPAPTPATNGASGSAKGAAGAAAGTTSSAKTAASGATPARGTPTSGAADSPKAAPASKATPPGATRTAAASEPQKHTRAAPAAKAALAPPAATPAAQKPVALARQTGKDSGTQRPASAPAVAPAKATSAEDFSVQVGSFGQSEQAERLRTSLAQKGYPARVQLSAVPGLGLRYRVRVGSYTERTAADQTAHHLTAQEQVPAIVAGKD